MNARRSGVGWLVGVIVVIAAAIAVWLYVTYWRVTIPAHAQSTPTSTSAPAPIKHPISQAMVPALAATASLPSLNASDAAVLQGILALPGTNGLRDLLLTQGIIPHVVATVDALPRHTIGSSIIPLRTPPGSFLVTATGGQRTLDPANAARYDAYMRIVEAIDMRTLVAWYVRNYPLFQQAYRELGYPRGYFNDRLIEAIDDMLAAPNAQPPVALLPTPNGHYVYADLTWESLSVGQKLMIRIGTDNEVRLKAKLREIRAALLGKLPRG